MEFLKDALRDRFVCGLHETTVQRKLLSEDDSLSLEKALKIAVSMETVAKGSAIIKEGIPTISRVATNLPQQRRGHRNQCSCCGKLGHSKRDCYYKDLKCHNCGRVGHLQAVCRQNSDVGKRNSKESKVSTFKKNKRSSKIKEVKEETSEFEVDTSDDGVTVYYVKTIASCKPVEVTIEGSQVTMELNTGAAISLIPKKLFDKTV